MTDLKQDPTGIPAHPFSTLNPEVLIYSADHHFFGLKFDPLISDIDLGCTLRRTTELPGGVTAQNLKGTEIFMTLDVFLACRSDNAGFRQYSLAHPRKYRRALMKGICR